MAFRRTPPSPVRAEYGTRPSTTTSQILRMIAGNGMIPAVIIGAEYRAGGEQLFDALQRFSVDSPITFGPLSMRPISFRGAGRSATCAYLIEQ